MLQYMHRERTFPLLTCSTVSYGISKLERLSSKGDVDISSTLISSQRLLSLLALNTGTGNLLLLTDIQTPN